MFNSVTEIETKITLTGPYVDVVQALRILEANHLFPLKTSGNITMHFDKQGDLVRIVPTVYLDL